MIPGAGLFKTNPILRIGRLLRSTRLMFKATGSLSHLMRTLGIPLTSLALPLSATLVSSILEGLCVGLMVPILQSIVQQTVEVGQLKIFDAIRVPFPLYFTSSRTRLLTYLICVMVLVSGIRVALNYFADCLMTKREQQFQLRVRTALFDRLLRFGKAFYDRHDYGALTNTILNSAYELGVAFENVKIIIQLSVATAIYALALFVLSPALATLSFLLLPWLYLVVALVIQRVARASTAQFATVSELNQKVSDTLHSVPLIKVYSMERRESARFAQLGQAVADVQYSANSKVYFIGHLQEIVSIIILGVLVFTANMLISKYDSNAGSHYLVFFFVLRRLSGNLNSLTQVFARITRGVGYVDKVQELLDTDTSDHVPSGEVRFKSLAQGVEFRRVNFGYGSGPLILRDLSFKIEKGSMVALVGPSGAGKSTILQLIQRMYDVQPGTLFVDGRDIRDYDTESLLKRIAVVSQDVFLFNNSMKYKICYGLENPPSELELWRAIKQAELDPLIKRMPEGLETRLGERGVRLSGGERQRISIARAMLKNAQLLLLDEATSSLDAETEASIQFAFDKLLKNRTCIVVAHRLSTIQHADKIVVIENGKVVEQGTFKSLLRQKGRFHRLHAAQKFAA